MKTKLLLSSLAMILLTISCKKESTETKSTDPLSGGTLIYSFPKSTIHDLYFFDKQTGIAVGNRYFANGDSGLNETRFFSTNDSLKTWQDYSLRDCYYFMNFQAVSKQFICAIAVPHQASDIPEFCVTKDLGQHWDRYPISTASADSSNSVSYEDVVMINEQDGFLCGHEGKSIWSYDNDYAVIYKTINGGKNWTRIFRSSTSQNMKFTSITYTVSGKMLVSGYEYLPDSVASVQYESNNYGLSWKRIQRNIPNLVYFKYQQKDGALLANAINMSMKNGSLSFSIIGLLKSMDEGQKWDTISHSGIKALSEYNSNAGVYAMGYSSYYSKDGFRTGSKISPKGTSDEMTGGCWMFTEKDFLVSSYKGDLYRFQLSKTP